MVWFQKECEKGIASFSETVLIAQFLRKNCYLERAKISAEKQFFRRKNQSRRFAHSWLTHAKDQVTAVRISCCNLLSEIVIYFQKL